MLIDLTAPLKTLHGADLRDDGAPVTLGGVLCNIIAALPTDAGVPSSERQKRFILSVRIAQATGAIDIDAADAGLMAKLINASALPPLFSEQIVCALEGKPNPLASLSSTANGPGHANSTGRPSLNSNAASTVPSI